LHEKIKIFKNKIKNISLDDIISIDESSFDSHLGSNKGWSKKGDKKILIRTNKKIRYSVICSISNKKVFLTKLIKGSCNGKIFLNYIKELINKLPKKRTRYLLIDNAKIHHYGELKKFVNSKNNIEIIYNVPYMPEYNPIERVFSEAKNNFNKLNTNDKNFYANIQKSFNMIKKDNLRKYFIKSLTFQ
jgi:putative transposase